MVDIEWRVNGKKIRPEQIGRELQKSVDKMVKDHVERELRKRRR